MTDKYIKLFEERYKGYGKTPLPVEQQWKDILKAKSQQTHLPSPQIGPLPLPNVIGVQQPPATQYAPWAGPPPYARWGEPPTGKEEDEPKIYNVRELGGTVTGTGSIREIAKLKKQLPEGYNISLLRFNRQMQAAMQAQTAYKTAEAEQLDERQTIHDMVMDQLRSRR